MELFNNSKKNVFYFDKNGNNLSKGDWVYFSEKYKNKSYSDSIGFLGINSNKKLIFIPRIYFDGCLFKEMDEVLDFDEPSIFSHDIDVDDNSENLNIKVKDLELYNKPSCIKSLINFLNKDLL